MSFPVKTRILKTWVAAKTACFMYLRDEMGRLEVGNPLCDQPFSTISFIRSWIGSALSVLAGHAAKPLKHPYLRLRIMSEKDHWGTDALLGVSCYPITSLPSKLLGHGAGKNADKCL